MWVRSAAIRPVPPFARLSREALEATEEYLGLDEDTTEEQLAEVFTLFEQEQPVLSRHIGEHLSRTGNEVAVALGYFLALLLFKTFNDVFAETLCRVGELELRSVEEAFSLDEQLRRDDPNDPVDSEDVVAMEQPHAVAFVNEHIEAALEVHRDDADVDAVHATYRLILIELLALGYAVAAPAGAVATSANEIYA